MDQRMVRKSAQDITAFIESTHHTQDLHFLASQSLQKWVDSLKDGIPNGYEKFKLWLEIREDLLGKAPVVTTAQDPSELRVASALVKNETGASQHQPVFLKVTSTSADSISVPAWLDVPPPHSRKRKAPPCEPFEPPSTNKPNMRLSGAESAENLDSRAVSVDTAVSLVTVPGASTPSNIQPKNLNNPIKKMKIESTERLSLSHPTVCSETECEQATSSSMDDSHAHAAPTSSKRICWTPEMDDRLKEAVLLYSDFGWKYVAQHCGGEFTAKKCERRYSTFVQYEGQDIMRSDKWTDAEVSALEQLVQKHTKTPHYNRKKKAMTQERIDWTSLGRVLGRRPGRCADKWDKIQRARNSTESAMNVTTTEPTCIEYAATAFSSASSSSPYSSSDDESSSSSGSSSETDSDSDSSSSSGSSSSQSSTVSQSHSASVGGGAGRDKTAGMEAESSGAAPQSSHWTKEEDERLAQLVALHTIQPRWDERRKVTTQERIGWTRIAKELNCTTFRCQDRWRCLESAKLKAGPFTEEEDILIECFVREWGDKGSGMWVRLEKDLGRPSSTIRRRWLTLSQRNVSTPCG